MRRNREFQVQQRIERDLHRTPQVDVPWMRMFRWETCKGESVEGIFCKEKEKRNSQGKDPRTFDENSQGGDLSTPQTNSQGRDPRTFKEPVERWRVQEKRKEEKWKIKKKKVKYRRNRWWKNAKRGS